MKDPGSFDPTIKKDGISAAEKLKLKSEIAQHGDALRDFSFTDPSFYDARAEIYDAQNESPERKRRQEMMDAFYHEALRPVLSGKEISYLDFGCATGTHTASFLEGLSKYASVKEGYALDISREMIKRAKEKLPGLKVREGGIDTISSKGTLDLITSFFHVLCHLDDAELQSFFTNAAASLKEGGVLCFDVIRQFEVGEHGYTAENEAKGEKYLLYNSLKPDGSKVAGVDGEPVIGTTRMFTEKEIISFAQGSGLEVVEIREFLVGKRQNIKDYAVILIKPSKN